MIEKFKKVIEEYNTVKTDFRKENTIVKLLTKEIPQEIMKRLFSYTSNLDKIKIKGSAGIGQAAETSWVAIFNKDITDTATRGFYLVFLIKPKSGMYLSLNQGFIYFDDKYKAKLGRKNVHKVADKLKNSLNMIPKYSEENIDLKCKNKLGKGYEAGNICAKYYDINNMPSDEELIGDIIEYMKAYDEIKGIIGERTIEQFYDYMLIKEDGYVISDEEEKYTIEDILVNENNAEYNLYDFKGEKKEKKECVIDDKGRKVYLRDPKVAGNAIKRAEYKCEFDEKHPSFIRKKDGKNYTESHHLIPMSFQEKFEYSLDVEENIISLCSNCHNCIHYGIDTERNKLLEKLYNERKEFLKNVGLDITFEELKRYYKIDS